MGIRAFFASITPQTLGQFLEDPDKVEALLYPEDGSESPNSMGLDKAWHGLHYLLTGDARYAHKAAVLLTRIAEVYPNMDHESQSRYGQLMAEKDGTRYTGKVIKVLKY